MTEKKLSTLGYLMDRLGLSTAGLARRLHVDASLVSKWRSGSRRLNVKSVYFEEICAMLLEQDGTAFIPWSCLRTVRIPRTPRCSFGGSSPTGILRFPGHLP